jgi:hypothetical protein
MLRKILTAVLFITFYSSYAQQAPIAIVSTNGTTRLTSTLDSASILAQDNDIIYLPGGTFTGDVNFFKKVTIIGVGHNPDSTSATGRTNITGSIGFYLGAEGSILDGVYVSSQIYVTTDNKIYRCNANIIYSTWSINVNNLIVDKCVIRGGVQGVGNLNNMYNSIIKNSIINAGADFVTNVHTSIFENNILLFNGVYGIETADQCTFKNCVFIGVTSWTTGPSNSFFLNNIFTIATLPTLTDVNNASGNHLNQSAASIFTSIPTTTYSYTNDYLINSSSPAITGGTGGTQIGIYGGSSPWVKGNIPPNPHIRTKNVDASTGTGGTLRVRFNVGVQ